MQVVLQQSQTPSGFNGLQLVKPRLGAPHAAVRVRIGFLDSRDEGAPDLRNECLELVDADSGAVDCDVRNHIATAHSGRLCGVIAPPLFARR